MSRGQQGPCCSPSLVPDAVRLAATATNRDTRSRLDGDCVWLVSDTPGLGSSCPFHSRCLDCQSSSAPALQSRSREACRMANRLHGFHTPTFSLLVHEFLVQELPSFHRVYIQKLVGLPKLRLRSELDSFFARVACAATRQSDRMVTNKYRRKEHL
jgi:hypothetical protein